MFQLQSYHQCPCLFTHVCLIPHLTLTDPVLVLSTVVWAWSFPWVSARVVLMAGCLCFSIGTSNTLSQTTL